MDDVFDRVTFNRVAPRVDLLLELCTRQHRARPPQQGAKEREFAVGERLSTRREHRLFRCRVEFDDSIVKGRPRERRSASSNRTYASQKLFDRKWLDEIVVSAGVEA